MMPVTVVVIDDSPMFLGLVTMFLERAQPHGFAIAGTARTGQEGVALVARVRPIAAVVDLGLPDMSGLNVVRRLRDDDPRLAIVVLTSADASFRDPVLTAGADAFVTKETLNVDLVSALLEAVRAHAPTVPLGDGVDA